ncbi:MAG TPA: FAD-binding protein [Gemmatimonadaceae bacterium]
MTATAIETTEMVRDRVRDARASRTPLRIVGCGTWLDAGRAVRATATLSTRDLNGIVAYVPGDLTMTARAGTTLAEIREATAVHNQWLALDPHGTDDTTLGATVSTASAGPLSTTFGTPRDLVLGVEFVTGMAAIARGGGRVVKNVAGFDLARLLTGSWGTLAVLTEITVRLHAKPAVDVSLAVPLSGSSTALRNIGEWLRTQVFTPYSCEFVNDALAAKLAGVSSAAAIFRLGGNEDAVVAQRQAVETLGAAHEVDASIWTALRGAEPKDAIVIRYSRQPSDIAQTWTEVDTLARDIPGALMHARPARGIVRLILPSSDAAISQLRTRLTSGAPVKRVGERLPAALWQVLAPRPTADALSTRIKQAFDPDSVLNPGILGEPT